MKKKNINWKELREIREKTEKENPLNPELENNFFEAPNTVIKKKKDYTLIALFIPITIAIIFEFIINKIL